MTPHDEAHIEALRDIAQCLMRRALTLVFHVDKALEGIAKDSPEAVHLQKARQIAKDLGWPQFWRLQNVVGDMMSARTARDRRRRIMRTLRSGHDFIDGELRWPPHEEEEGW